MNKEKEGASTLSWWVFFAVVAVLLLISALIVWNQYRHSHEIMRHTAQDRLAVLKATVGTALEEGSYDTIQPLFDEWGTHHPHALQLSLTARNGFSYGNYQRASPSKHVLRLEETISYGYRGSAFLSYTLDISYLRAQLNRTIAAVAAALFIVILFSAHLVRANRSRAKEARQLAQMGRELDRRNTQLGAEHALLQAVIDSLPDLIYFKSTHGAYDGANRAFCDFHGIDHTRVVGRNDSELFDQPQADERNQRDLEIIAKREAQRGDTRARSVNNETVLLDASHTPYFDNAGKLLGMIGIERDVTRLREYQDNLETMAYRDPLTGLPNRRYLIDRMQKDMAGAIRHGRKLAVIALDLDGFKPINDRYGHEMGDKVIIAFASRLQTLLREDDTVARWGGDEFSVLFNDIDGSSKSTQLVDRMIEMISAPFRVGDIKIQLTASIGITIYPDDNQDADTLLRHADQAMYQSKQSGKNTFTFFNPEQDRIIHSQAKRLVRFTRGIEMNELRVHYQPQINMLDGSLHGVEALARWQHPEEGLLPPSEFLPLLENHPVGIQLDWWVVERVLKQLNEWQGRTAVPMVSVNLAAMTLQQSDFVERLQSLLEWYPVGVHSLQMEILETSALQDIDQVTDTIERCRRIGVSFALDDFGTGYSSLTYLRRLPAQVLKIDRSFIRDMLHDKDDLKIVEGILRLAEAFDRIVLAEGVESIEHGVQLLKLGCTYAQGFGVAKPMPAEQFAEWAGRYRLPIEWSSQVRSA